MKKFDIVIPSIVADIDKLICNIPCYRKYISYRNIVVIGNDDVREKIEGIEGIRFVDENSLVPFPAIKDKINSLTYEASQRAGWYYQQFLKMSYARCCEDEYYLLWDSDTIPLHEVDMLLEDFPVFHIKDEYNKAYFDTINNLFGYSKVILGSFISEHMIINTGIMRNMLNELEKDGSNFYEVILDNVPIEELRYSGFSEFETYGTYCYMKAKNLYSLCEWKSLRNGAIFFDWKRLSPKLLEWVGREFDAMSFEKTDRYDTTSRFFFNSLVKTFTSFSFANRMYWHFTSAKKKLMRKLVAQNER